MLSQRALPGRVQLPPSLGAAAKPAFSLLPPVLLRREFAAGVSNPQHLRHARNVQMASNDGRRDVSGTSACPSAIEQEEQRLFGQHDIRGDSSSNGSPTAFHMGGFRSKLAKVIGGIVLLTVASAASLFSAGPAHAARPR